MGTTGTFRKIVRTFIVWFLVWAFAVFRHTPSQGQSQHAFQPGDYRTASAGHLSQTEGSSQLEQLTAQGIWIPATYPLPASATLYVQHATQLFGSLELAHLQLTRQNALSILSSSKLVITSNLIVEPQAELILTGELENKGLLQLQASSKLIIQSPSYQASSLVWAGTEEIDASSEVRIEAAAANATLFSSSQLSPQAHGFWFGNITFAPTVSSTYKLADASAPFTAQAFSAMLPANASLTFLDGSNLGLSFGREVTLRGGAFFIQNQASGTGTLTISGTLALQNASLTLNQTSTANAVSTLDLKSNLVTDATSLIANSSTVSTSTSGIRFSGNSWQTLAASGPINHVSLAIKPGALVRLGQHVRLNPSNSVYAGTLSVENGATLDFSADASQNGFQVQGQGYFRLEQGGTLFVTSAQGLNSTGAAGNVQVTDSRRTFNQLATFIFNAKVPQQTGNAFPGTASGKVVIIDNPTSVTVTNSFGVSNSTSQFPDGGRLEIRKGDFIATSTADVTSSGKLVMSGGTYKITMLNTQVPLLTGAYEFSGGAIELSGNGNQTLKGKTYYSVIVSGDNTAGNTFKTISTTTTITHNLSVLPNAILDISNKTLRGDGGLAMSGGLFRIGKSNGTLPELVGKNSPFALTGGTIEFYGTSNAQTQSIKGTDGNGQKITYHHLLLTALEANTLNESGNHLLSGNFDVSGTLTVRAPAVLQIANNRAISGVGNFTLEPGATLLYGSAQGIRNSGTGTSDGNIRVSGSRNFSEQANYGFIGNGDMVTGDALPSIVANLLVAKTGGVVTLTKSVNVAEVFTLKSGLFKTDAHEVSLLRQDASALQLADPAFYIQGNLRRAVGSSGTYSFPIGTATGKRQLEIMSIGLSGNNFQSIVVGFKSLANHQDADMFLLENDLSYTHINTEGVWHVEPNAKPASGSFTAMASLQGFSNLTDNKFALLIRPIHSTSGKDWETGGGTLDAPDKEGRTVAGGFAKRNFITPFGQLGIATMEQVTPLPVSWLSLSAERKGQQVHVRWATASELNNERFEVEYSSDGKNFLLAGTITGAGTSSLVNQYQYQHLSPARATTYYRIRQIDYDGKFEYSKVVAVKAGEAGLTQLVAYPNPSQDYLHLPNLTLEAATRVEILDAKGYRMKNVTPEMKGGVTTIPVHHLPAGNYLLQVTSAGHLSQYRFLKL